MTALCRLYSIGNPSESQPMGIADSRRDSTGSSRPEPWFTAAFIAYCCLGAHFLMRNSGGVDLHMPAKSGLIGLRGVLEDEATLSKQQTMPSTINIRVSRRIAGVAAP
ncbi:MAG: hypothetical protein ACI9SB_000115 [Candidatus Azotimanducaceae bacterium]|jgi:hypothetical protein